MLFGTPAAEPYQAEGFYREAGGPEGDSFLWVKEEPEVSLTWTEVVVRVAVLDLAPYSGVKDQRVEVRLNGTTLARLAVSDLRRRYQLTFPIAAQRKGENKLRFVFAKTASPADADPGNADRRRLAAAFYSLTVGSVGDPTLEDLLSRDAPSPFSVTEAKGAPSLTLVGPSVVRYAIGLPSGAELRFAPDLHPAARAAGAQASFRVTLEERAGTERELWSRVIEARDKAPGEVRLALPGETGAIVRLGLHVGGERFAWGTWGAPRLLGREAADPLAARPISASDDRRAASLRQHVAGSNVLLIVLDAGRAREFGCYGYPRFTTPEIDRLAREGVIFESVFTPAVYTLGAMSSVWTSQHPDRHHSEVSFSARLPRDRLTLAEVLAARGIQTAGFVANSVAGKALGFDRGFGEFREVFGDPELGSRAELFRRVVPSWLEAHKAQRFFAYVHFREPHFPYDPPPPFDTRFGPDSPLSKAARGDFSFFVDVNQGRRPFSPEEREHLLRLYDGNLAYADQELGQVRRALEAQGLWDKTVVIVTADHGEGLGEHGWIGHNVQVYDESAHVPLIVRFPTGGGSSGLRIKGLADLLDLAPTIMDLMGVRGEGPWQKEFQGRSLLPMIAGAPGQAVVLSRTVWDRPIYALRDQAFKFIYDTRTGEEKLFDLVHDPGETRDVRETEPLRAAYYREALHHWTLGLGERKAAAAEEAQAWTREQCENMKALGYLGGDFRCPEK